MLRLAYLISITTFFIVAFNLPAAANSLEPIIMIEDRVITSDIPPKIEEGRILVPLRVISESLGAKVTWVNDEKMVQIDTTQKSIKLKVNNPTAYVGQDSITLTVPPRVIENRIFVPIRFVCENLDSEVNWDNEKKIVNIKPIPQKQIDQRSLKKIYVRDYIVWTAIDLIIKKGTNNVNLLSNPDRLVIDLGESINEIENFESVKTNQITGIKVEQNNETGTRVIINTKEKMSYNTIQSDDYLTIYIGSEADIPSQIDDSLYAEKKINVNSNTVVLDPGHGGRDVGAIGVSGRFEKDINLSISHKVKEFLEDKGFIVVMTREDDSQIKLDSVVNVTNSANAFAFISIHSNKFNNPDVNGLETYTFNGTDKTLANLVQDSIIKKTNLNNRGVKEAKFYVIKYAQIPAVLVECGFISNQVEEEFLFNPENQAIIAKAIADSVEEFKNQIKLENNKTNS